MAFVFQGAGASTPQLAHEDDSQSSLSSPPSSFRSAPISDHDMKERPRVEILLDKDPIFLKGTGVDVEPARLSGHVALYLAESTSIKEITLQLKGKARLAVQGHDTFVASCSFL